MYHIQNGVLPVFFFEMFKPSHRPHTTTPHGRRRAGDDDDDDAEGRGGAF